VTIPTRIQRLLDDRALETIQATDADVAALWDKAVRSDQLDQLRKLLDSSLPAAHRWLTAAQPLAHFTPLP
jgi:hypothetical protein